MAETLSFPAAEPSVGLAQRADLVSRLDELLERYLNTLDEYQKEQQKLSSAWSSNRTHVRYGRDHYDERMQALRTVMITEEDSKIAFSVSPRHSAPLHADNESAIMPGRDTSDDFTVSSEGTSANSDAAANNSQGKTVHPDPLRWFGVLTPPGLRTAQALFVSVIEGPIPRLAMISKELRSLEIDIGRLRKQIKKL